MNSFKLDGVKFCKADLSSNKYNHLANCYEGPHLYYRRKFFFVPEDDIYCLTKTNPNPYKILCMAISGDKEYNLLLGIGTYWGLWRKKNILTISKSLEKLKKVQMLK